MSIKLGAEPKKVVFLACLLVAAAYLLYTNVLSAPGDSSASASAPKLKQPQAHAVPPNSANAAVAARTPPPATRRRNNATVQDWVPTLKRKANEPAPDPATTDPTLRLDLLAKLQSVTIQGAERSLFDFSSAPIPKQPEAIIKPGKPKPGSGTAIAGATGATDPAKPADAKPVKPPAPPIPLKFYGFITARDGKRAFFLNGDDIFTAIEGTLIQSRYKVVRIGVNSAVIEDTQFSNQQTIRLEEAPPPTGAG